jgi:hypothetical protein
MHGVWSRVLEIFIVVELVTNLPAYYGTLFT